VPPCRRTLRSPTSMSTAVAGTTSASRPFRPTGFYTNPRDVTDRAVRGVRNPAVPARAQDGQSRSCPAGLDLSERANSAARCSRRVAGAAEAEVLAVRAPASRSGAEQSCRRRRGRRLLWPRSSRDLAPRARSWKGRQAKVILWGAAGGPPLLLSRGRAVPDERPFGCSLSSNATAEPRRPHCRFCLVAAGVLELPASAARAHTSRLWTAGHNPVEWRFCSASEAGAPEYGWPPRPGRKPVRGS
jgi:hypothetical protein